MLKDKIREKEEVIFEGEASSVLLPGTDGEFEVLDFHKPIMSRLKKGSIIVDNKKELRIKSGIVKMDHQNLVAVVEK
ncbi:MAG: hypothetical protein JW893_02235 [Candidatus Omnitrophica bacterium]|nr:hypothetical protein [Candidatus Omnitrophota bacterium]